MSQFTYLVGGLVHGTPPEAEQEKLNECARAGWELVSVVLKTIGRATYTFFYFRRPIDYDGITTHPRFDFSFS